VAFYMGYSSGFIRYVLDYNYSVRLKNSLQCSIESIV